jgi:hypothetical protein
VHDRWQQGFCGVCLHQLTDVCYIWSSPRGNVMWLQLFCYYKLQLTASASSRALQSSDWRILIRLSCTVRDVWSWTIIDIWYVHVFLYVVGRWHAILRLSNSIHDWWLVYLTAHFCLCEKVNCVTICTQAICFLRLRSPLHGYLYSQFTWHISKFVRCSTIPLF